MASQDKIVSDGYVDWSGGMDSSRSPSYIEKNQYVWSTNCNLNKDRSGVCCRAGYRPIDIVFSSDREENIYKSGDFQGDGSYFFGTEAIILISISGYIFQLREISRFKYSANIINTGAQNNPNNANCFITGVKDGAVINDGEGAPFQVTLNNASRVTGKFRIKPGYAGIYVQNRFFYIDQTRQNIFASTIRNPFSMEEAYASNIYGFTAPEDNDYLTAIGRISNSSTAISGGNLSFSTFNNNYSVDVRGAMSSWGKVQSQITNLGNISQQYIGFVQSSIPDIGAISPYSYESINSNLYFRNIGKGLVSLKATQSEFQNTDGYTSQSIEANEFFNNDSEIFLPQCRTKSFNNRLLTTVYPFQKNNSVLWRGLISYVPVPYSSSREGILPSYFESVYTGLNMHSILPIKYPDDKQDLFISCVDKNGNNVIYVLDDSIDYDINSDGKTSEIERKILTRAFDFNASYVLKSGHSQSYAISELNRDNRIEIYSRKSDDGKFFQQSDLIHKVAPYTNKGKFILKPYKEQQRQYVPIANDPIEVSQCTSSPNNYLLRQDLIKVTGSCNIVKWVRSATILPPEITAAKKESIGFTEEYKEIKIYDYKI